jgi:hypothetical protein
MAGDWIKMRTDLQTDPRVVTLAAQLKRNRLETVGALHAFWSLADTHSVDGELPGYTPNALDEMIRIEGFTAALESVDWIEIRENSLVLPDFDKHNGQSAKRRAQAMERMRVARGASRDANTSVTRDRVRDRERVNTDKQAPPPTNDPSSATNPPTVCPSVCIFRHEVETHCQKRLSILTRNKKPMFDMGAIRAITKNVRCTPERVEWAVGVFKETINKRKPPKNAAAYIRSLIEGDAGPEPKFYPHQQETA